MSSPLEVVETGVAAELDAITSLASIKIAPFIKPKRIEDDGTATITIDDMTLPDGYPGAVLSLNDEDIAVTVEEWSTTPYVRKLVHRVAVLIAIYAHSDPNDANARPARHVAWEIAHEAIDRLSSYTLTGIPAPWEFDPDVLAEGPMSSMVIDQSTHLVLLRFYADYYITAP